MCNECDKKKKKKGFLLQLRTLPLGIENIYLPSDETRKKAYELANQAPLAVDGKKKLKRGELEFEALMRHLDNAVS